MTAGTPECWWPHDHGMSVYCGRMLYIVPSRGRPGNIRELLETWEATRQHANLWICVDNDDPHVDEYSKIKLPPWAATWVGPRKRLGPTLNDYTATYCEALHGGPRQTDIIGFMGDDHRPRTPQWDRIIYETVINRGTGVYYGNDLLQGPALPTAVAMTGDIIGALGYMSPPGLIHLFLDNAWKDIGKATRLNYLPNVVIEHMHPVAKKAEWDAGYTEVNANQQYVTDGEAYRAWFAASDWRDALLDLMNAQIEAKA